MYKKILLPTDGSPLSATAIAQGVALAAQRLGCKATIVMPVTSPTIKIQAVEARGATVVLHGDSYSDAYAHAAKLRLGHVDAHPELRRLKHPRDRLVGGDEVPGTQVYGLDDARGGRRVRRLLEHERPAQPHERRTADAR